MTDTRVLRPVLPLLLLAAGAWGAQQDDPVVKALEAYRRGNCREARPLLEQVLARQPKNEAVKRLLSTCKDAPEPKLATAATVKPRKGAPSAPLAAQQKRQSKRAAERRIAPSKPSMSEAAPPPTPAPPKPVTERDHAGPKYAEAELLIKSKRFKEASVLLVQVVRERPNLVLPRLRLAEIYSANSMFAEAASQYTAIAGLPGAPPDAGLRVAQNLNWGKKLPESAAAYVDYLEVSPSSAEGRLGLANVLFWQNKLPEAAGEY